MAPFMYFTPVGGLVGGILIGLSAAALLLFNGDVLGASGVMSSFVVNPRKTLLDPSDSWKAFFVPAFFVVSNVVLLIFPDALDDVRSVEDPSVPVASPLAFVVGGFLVGFGTRLGNGCTTGHGICGLARLSTRSLAGVVSFMAAGIAVASTLPNGNPHLRSTAEEMGGKYGPSTATNAAVTSIVGLVAVFAIAGLARNDNDNGNRRKILPSIGAAFLFSIGLYVSRMTIYSKIFGFLDFRLMPKGMWDPTLALVMGGGLAVSFASYQWVNGFNVIPNSHALQCPLSQKDTAGEFSVPTSKIIDAKLIVGEAIFGLGWGIAGLCPGPAMVLASCGYPNVLLRWWPTFFVGAFLAERAKSLFPSSSAAQGVSPEGGKDELSEAVIDDGAREKVTNEIA